MNLKVRLIDYKRKTQFYETDEMGIIHHSNYVKWLEEARFEGFLKIGIDYKKISHNDHISSPLLKIEIEYLNPLTYGELITIATDIISYNGIRFVVSYTILNSLNVVMAKAVSSHCFIKDKKVISLKRIKHEIDLVLEKKINESS